MSPRNLHGAPGSLATATPTSPAPPAADGDEAAFARGRWRSFQRGGSVAIYVGLHAITFLFTTLYQLNGFVPVFIYLSYMSMSIFAIYLAMGTVGFASSLWFVYAIFKAVKQD
jgi:hypothetical protein